MIRRIFPSFVIAGLALVLWVVPSVGTQGMGTIGQRFGHPDSILVDGPTPTGRSRGITRDTLQAADAAIEAALGY